jgi:hypothetical protein
VCSKRRVTSRYSIFIGGEVILVFYNIQCSPQGTQQCNISIGALVMPRSADHHSVIQVQVYISQVVIVQLMIISVQQFTVWFGIQQGAITIIVLPKGYNLQVTTYGTYGNFKCNINPFQPCDTMWRHIFHLSLICIRLPIDYSSLLSTLRWLLYARLYMLKSPNIWTRVSVVVWFVGVAAAAPTKQARTGTFVHIYIYICVCVCVFWGVKCNRL